MLIPNRPKYDLNRGLFDLDYAHNRGLRFCSNISAVSAMVEAAEIFEMAGLRKVQIVIARYYDEERYMYPREEERMRIEKENISYVRNIFLK